MFDLSQCSREKACQLAESENTSPDILESLSVLKTKDILQRIASNPNTPLSVLEKLSQNFPDEVINNPVCDLLYLENPQQMDFLNIPMAKSPVTPEEKLIRLAKTNNYNYLLVQRTNLSAAVIKVIFENTNFCNPILALRKNTPIEILEKIAASVTKKNRDITDITIHDLQVRVALLEFLATNPYWLIRRKIANLPHIPIHLLEQLALDECEFVRMGVVYNPKCPEPIFEKLKKDKSKHVRYSAAKKLNNTASVLEYFAKDTEWLVRREVAKHANTPLPILQELAEDESEYVKTAAMKSLKSRIN